MFGETFSLVLVSALRVETEHCPLQIGPEAKRISEWEQKWRALRTRTEEQREDGWGMGFYEGFCSAEN